MRAQVTQFCAKYARSCWDPGRRMYRVESIYLSSEQPRLQLASESDLLAAVAAELLEENHFLDLKREVAAGKAQNKETARDFAQFAVDGGTLIIGLEEADDESILLSPQPLQGLPERIEQIARANCDPPLDHQPADSHGGGLGVA